MTDYYGSMTELYKCEPVGNYNKRSRTIENEHRIVLGLHGGSVEPGVSELTLGIAGGVYDINSKYNYWLWESLRPIGENGGMHVTSVNFDDEAARILTGKATMCVAVHGCADTIAGGSPGDRIAWVGGLDTELRDDIILALQNAGFDAEIASDPTIAGTNPLNICNRTSSEVGVQIETTVSLRASFFSVNTLAGRATSQTQDFWDFCTAVRSAMP